MSRWPGGWKEATLRDAALPVTDFALTVLTAWANSTPTEPWTNNPLGMPAHGNQVPRALNTPYGLFPTMGTFRRAFSGMLKTNAGTNLARVLYAGDELPEVWREIHKLKWPGNATETDYPCVLLDMLEDDYRKKMSTRTVANRKTVGSMPAAPAVHEAMRQQSYALTYASSAFKDGATAIAHIMRRLG